MDKHFEAIDRVRSKKGAQNYLKKNDLWHMNVILSYSPEYGHGQEIFDIIVPISFTVLYPP